LEEIFHKEADMDEYFRDLDREFIGIDKVDDETFHYKGTDVLVQSTWELPLIVQWPGSKINFEFSTLQGDIQFGIVFVAALEENQQQNDVEVETIEEMTRHRSDVEPIAGSFEPPCEGVVFFLWDNTYDWSSVKKLSYSVDVFQVRFPALAFDPISRKNIYNVQLFILCFLLFRCIILIYPCNLHLTFCFLGRQKQPSFTVPDADRCYTARNQLYDVVEDLEIAYIRRADEEDRLDHVGPNVDIIEDQLSRLQRELDVRVAALRDCEDEEEQLLTTIYGNYLAIPGLGLRYG
jgi:hypothetical protein